MEYSQTDFASGNAESTTAGASKHNGVHVPETGVLGERHPGSAVGQDNVNTAKTSKCAPLTKIVGKRKENVREVERPLRQDWDRLSQEFKGYRAESERLRQERDKFGENNTRLLQERNSYRLQAEELEQQRKLQMREAASLVQRREFQLEEQRAATAHLDADYQDLYRRYTTLRETVRDESVTYKYQKTDEAICQAFNDLIGRIKTWVLKAVSPAPDARLQSIEPEGFEKLKHVAPQQKSVDGLMKYVSDTKLRKYLIRGLVTFMISESMFRDSSHQMPNSTQTARDRFLGPEAQESVHILEQELLRTGSLLAQVTKPNFAALSNSLIHHFNRLAAGCVSQMACHHNGASLPVSYQDDL